MCVIVIGRIGKPVALAATDDVGAEDLPPGTLECVREIIEVAPVARKAVHTDHRGLRRRLPPFGIGDAMKAAGTAAVELFFVHAGSVKRGRIVNPQESDCSNQFCSLLSHWFKVLLT